MRIMVQRTRGASCPSDLRLDRHLAGELDEASRRSMESHLTDCSSCRERVVARQGDEDLPPLRAPAARRRLVWGATSLAAAAAVLFFLRPEPPVAPLTRAKGDHQVGLYVQHAGAVRAGASDEVVSPGDTIQLTTSLAARRWVAALSVDAGGIVSVYHGQDPRAGWQPAGEEVPLPASVRLDATLGREMIHVLLCRAPIELGPIEQMLRRHPDALPVHEGCERETLRLDKRDPR